MQRIVANGVVLGRLNFGEADRILTVITPNQGKLRLMAKGVRKSTSKMAGGIELLSITNLTFIPGKRDISTLISSRLVTYFGNIVSSLERTNLAYETLKTINDVTESECEAQYYDLLVAALEAINNSDIDLLLIRVWFLMHILRLLGHEPNLATTISGDKLQAGVNYRFDFEAMSFEPAENGSYRDQHIKLLRLTLTHSPEQLQNISVSGQLLQSLNELVNNLFQATS